MHNIHYKTYRYQANSTLHTAETENYFFFFTLIDLHSHQTINVSVWPGEVLLDGKSEIGRIISGDCVVEDDVVLITSSDTQQTQHKINQYVTDFDKNSENNYMYKTSHL